MFDLDVSASINGPDIDIDLTSANGYDIVSIGPGGRTWAKQIATSRYQHGRAVTGQVLDMMTGSLVVRVRATSHSQLATRLATLIDGLEQPSYTFTAVIEGVTWSWTCETADTLLGDSGVLDKFGLMHRYQLLSATLPRFPVALSGPV